MNQSRFNKVSFCKHCKRYLAQVTMRPVTLAVILLFVSMFTFSCYKDEIGNLSNEPADSDSTSNNHKAALFTFSPLSFMEGDTVTIQGANFDKNSTVYFCDTLTKIRVQATRLIFDSLGYRIMAIAPNISSFPGNGVGRVLVKWGSDSLWSPNVFTKSQWRQVTFFPGTERAFPFTFGIGENIYIGGGESVYPNVFSSVRYFDDVWEYNTRTKIWRQMASFSVDPAVSLKRSHATAFVIDGKAYVGTGCNWDYSYRDQYGNVAAIVKNNFRDCYEFDPAGNGTWRRVADMPLPFALGDAYHSTIPVDIPATSYSKESLAFCSIGLKDVTSFVVNGSGYVGMGMSETLIPATVTILGTKYTITTDGKNYPIGNQSAVYKFLPDPQGQGTWTQVADYPMKNTVLVAGTNKYIADNAVRGAFAFVLGGRAIVGCGTKLISSGAAPPKGLPDTYSYDPVAKTWTPLDELPFFPFPINSTTNTFYRHGGFGFVLNVKGSNKGYVTADNIYVTPNAVFRNLPYAPLVYDPLATPKWGLLPMVPLMAFNAGLFTIDPQPTDISDSGGGGACFFMPGTSQTPAAAFYYGRTNTIWKFIP